MRFIVKQKIFSWGSKYTISDQNKQVRYLAKSNVISIRRKFWLTTPDERKLYYLEQVLFKLMPTFKIYKGQELVGNFKAKFTMIKKKTEITSKYGEYTLQGDFFGWDFTLLRNGTPAARITKKISLADSYAVDIMDRSDPAFILSLIILLDHTYHRGASIAG